MATTYSDYSNMVVGKTWNSKAVAFLLRADATGESRPVAWDGYLNELIQGLIDDGNFDTTKDVIVNTRGGIGIGAQTARLNLIKNAHNAIEVNSPTYTAGTGYNSDGSSSTLRADYIINSQAVKYTLSNASFGLKTGGSIASGTRIIGTNTGYLYIGHYGNSKINSTADGTTEVIPTGYVTLTKRNDIYKAVLIKGTTEIEYTSASNAMPTNDMYLLSWFNTIPVYFHASTTKLEQYFFGSAMSAAMTTAWQNRWNTFYSQTC